MKFVRDYGLQNCFAIPKLLYVLWTSPSWRSCKDLVSFDGTIREALQSICKIRMEDCVWSQATLPLSKGGLGIRKSEDLAFSTFLSSSYSSQELVSSVLSSGVTAANSDPLVLEAEELWKAKSDSLLPPLEFRGRQKVWDVGILTRFMTIFQCSC